MDKQQFYQELIKQVQKKVGFEVKISLQRIPKNNGIWQEGLVFQKKGETISPVLYFEEYYELWKEGVTIGFLAEKVLWNYEHCETKFQVGKDFFMDYEEVRPQIYYRLINYERNRELLEQLVYRRFLDLAIVFYYEVKEGETTGSILIRKEHLKLWNITAEELEENAKIMTFCHMPPVMTTMEQMLRMMEGIEEEHEIQNELQMYIVSNQTYSMGAGTILYPGLMEQIAEILGDHFYILPSSIHECIILPQVMVDHEEDLLAMVTEINKEHVDPKEVLADQVYYYSKKDGNIHIL